MTSLLCRPLAGPLGSPNLIMKTRLGFRLGTRLGFRLQKRPPASEGSCWDQTTYDSVRGCLDFFKFTIAKSDT